jgi:hypothetical protein
MTDPLWLCLRLCYLVRPKVSHGQFLQYQGIPSRQLLVLDVSAKGFYPIVLKLPALVALALASLAFLPLEARADSIQGLSITVTSVFDSDAPQQFTFHDIGSIAQDVGIFSDWMTDIDSGTFLEFIPASEDEENEFIVSLSGNSQDGLFPFQPTDDIVLTVQLPSDYVFASPIALINVIQNVTNTTVEGNTLSFEISGLDFTADSPGDDEFIFNVEQIPEPGTLSLFVIAGAAMICRQFRSKSHRAVQ